MNDYATIFMFHDRLSFVLNNFQYVEFEYFFRWRIFEFEDFFILGLM